MMLGTHACLPVIGATIVDIYQLSNKRERLFTNWQLFFIGIAGMLPDLLWPHFSMQARLSSYTHTIWFLIALIPVTFIFATKYYTKNAHLFTLVFVLAASLHIAVDAISGGVALFYPNQGVWGMRLIPFRYWYVADAVFFAITIGLNVIRSQLQRQVV